MARTSTYSVAASIVVALVAALALGSLFVGSVAHADTWSSSSTQSWGHSNDHNWNNNSGWNNNNWNHDRDNHNWSNNNWGHGNNNWWNNGNNWNHNDHDWWRWHRVGSQWQQYFNWTLYCQWAYQTYGYVSAQCAPYVYSGYNSVGY